MNWVVSLGVVERRDPMNIQKLSRFSFSNFCVWAEYVCEVFVCVDDVCDVL